LDSNNNYESYKDTSQNFINEKLENSTRKRKRTKTILFSVVIVSSQNNKIFPYYIFEPKNNTVYRSIYQSNPAECKKLIKRDLTKSYLPTETNHIDEK
jgi:hypothetical protein